MIFFLWLTVFNNCWLHPAKGMRKLDAKNLSAQNYIIGTYIGRWTSSTFLWTWLVGTPSPCTSLLNWYATFFLLTAPIMYYGNELHLSDWNTLGRILTNELTSRYSSKMAASKPVVISISFGEQSHAKLLTLNFHICTYTAVNKEELFSCNTNLDYNYTHYFPTFSSNHSRTLKSNLNSLCLLWYHHDYLRYQRNGRTSLKIVANETALRKWKTN